MGFVRFRIARNGIRHFVDPDLKRSHGRWRDGLHGLCSRWMFRKCSGTSFDFRTKYILFLLYPVLLQDDIQFC